LADWTDDELRAAVRSYLSMAQREQRGEPYSKTEERRSLLAGPLKTRTHPGIEYRMRNISAVLAEHGRPILSGYLAAGNVGTAVSARIWALIEAETKRRGRPEGVAVRHPARRGSRTPPPMIYFNIGWMKHYAGTADDDPTIGGHSYLGSNRHGAEAFNFASNVDDFLRGYRPPGSAERTNITRLGAKASDTWLDGVTVVWLAREPGTRETLVVGWYNNARVFREARPGDNRLNGELESFSAEARTEDCRLLPVVMREFRVESSRTAPGAGFGQKPTWFGHPEVNQRVWEYILGFDRRAAIRRKASDRPTGKPPRNHDPELRRKVERAAVDHATAYYEDLFGKGCWRSVENLARGWDLEVDVGNKLLLVEVKGLLRGELVCELTPNEYAKMRSRKYRSRYVVYVVNNALAAAPEVPVPSVFLHVRDDVWRTADGRQLVIAPKMAAVLTCR